MPETLRFNISAAVVFRLGEELITDVVQALVELVKNSYDADATWVKVAIDTHSSNERGRQYADTTGVILVEDNGYGMDASTIQRGWVTIANSPKREQKAAGRVTPHGRTPIGDKGLGRLASQRLARNVEIVTRPQAQPTSEYYVAFSWADFREATNLRDVPLTVQRCKVSGNKYGTKVILSDLREPEIWRSERYLLDLQRKLSGMISPFQDARTFRVHLQVDGKNLGLAQIAQRVRETAQLKYNFKFDGNVFCISGKARLNYLQPKKKSDRLFLNSLCRSDQGKALYKFLAGRTRKSRSYFELSDEPGWFVRFGTRRVLDDLDGVHRVDRCPVDPGPFRGEVDVVSLDSSDYKSHTFDRRSDYRRLVRDLAGIRVYRDGFGIRVGADWLNLGKQWTGGSSYYGLRPGNVLGYVAISAKDNPTLVETTSREGFQVTPSYQNFVGLLLEFVRFAGEFQEFLRRGVLQFLNQRRDQDAGVKPEEKHPKITRRLDNVARRLSSENRNIQHHAGSSLRAAAEAAKTLAYVRDELNTTINESGTSSSALDRLEDALKVVSEVAANTEKMLNEVSNALDHASDLQLLREVLDRRWEMLQEEVSALYESISLGLTAEALSHEIHNIADRLARRSTSLLRNMKSAVRMASIIAYVEHVRSSVATMRKQLAHLTPSLRYLREMRERIEVLPWVKKLALFFDDKLSAKRIEVVILRGDSPEFAVNMNKGKLTQVFDNLLLNAEYWLIEAIRTGAVKNGQITIVVDAPVVRVMDNGRGVDQSVEGSLFEPFVTTKRSQEGRGLGLFVARQLLDSESCGIMLLPDRNVYGRRYVFEVDLSGALIA